MPSKNGSFSYFLLNWKEGDGNNYESQIFRMPVGDRKRGVQAPGRKGTLSFSLDSLAAQWGAFH